MTRADAVQSLVQFDGPIETLRDQIAAFPFDWLGPPLAILRREHVLSVLGRWRRGELSAEEVEEWANLVEVRDDLYHDPADEAVASAVFDLANPEIKGSLEHVAPALSKALDV